MESSHTCRHRGVRRGRKVALITAAAAVAMLPLCCSAFGALIKPITKRNMTLMASRHPSSIISKPVNRRSNGNICMFVARGFHESGCDARQQRHTGTMKNRFSPASMSMSSAPNSSSGDKGTAATADIQSDRINAMHNQLITLGIDADDLASAATRSITTTEGYDAKYGKSAIKAYRTYVNPRPSKSNAVQKEDVDVAAARCARQIDFLAKRHRSHEAEWVRHTDTVAADDDDASNTNRKKRFPLTIVLDNVRSAFNVGSIFRTSDACNCAEIITTGITPHPNGSGAEKLAKSALGADRVVPSRHFATTVEAVQYLRAERPEILLVGMETTELSKCYTDVLYPGGDKTSGATTAEISKDGADKTGTALFLGNEVTGVDTEVMPLLDMVVEIPMFGKKNSLNIAASAPVVMYEILRQWGCMN